MAVLDKISMRVKCIGGNFCSRCGHWSIKCYIFVAGDQLIWKPSGCLFAVCDECLERTLKDWDATMNGGESNGDEILL